MPRWLTIFIDLPRPVHEPGTDFWCAATGYALSTTRGEHNEFATLVPSTGDAHLRIQRTDADLPGVHLDLHVADLDQAVADAVGHGAVLLAHGGHAVLRSPAGFVFCLVDGDETHAAPPAEWDGHRSRVDQLTIDIAHEAWETEQAFWSHLTGWDVARGSRSEFARLGTPAELPVRILLQRLDHGETHGHIDIATDDRVREVGRLEGHGARVRRVETGWTVMTVPGGGVLCVTDRRPETGLLS